MIYLAIAIVVFFIHLYLFFSWWQSRKRQDGKEKCWCFFGCLLGQLYLVWELFLVKQTGQPASGSPEQLALMGRMALGVSPGGFFIIIGLLYISFATHGANIDKTNERD